jgi:hypothetical protein
MTLWRAGTHLGQVHGREMNEPSQAPFLGGFPEVEVVGPGRIVHQHERRRKRSTTRQGAGLSRW